MSYTVIECPQCGGEMNTRSKVCKNCFSAHKVTVHKKDACPLCGKIKDHRAKTCKACQYKPGKSTSRPRVPQDSPTESYDSDWAFAFAGFFAGDGHIALQRSHNKNPTARIELSISQRADNIVVLKSIHRKLGGYLRIADKSTSGNPIAHWRLTGLDKIEKVLEIFVACPLPSKKREEARVALEFVKWRKSIPVHMTPEQRAHSLSFADCIKDIRAFKVQG